MSAHKESERDGIITLSDGELTQKQAHKSSTMNTVSVRVSKPKKSPQPKSKEDSTLQILKDIQKNQCTKKDLQQYMDAVNKRLDGAEQALENHSQSLGNHSEWLKELQTRMDEHDTRAEAAKIETELQKQKSLKNNLNLIGVPFIQNEDLVALVIAIFGALDIPVARKDISAAYRTGRKNIIIVKMVSYEQKLLIIQARAKKAVKVRDFMDANDRQSEDFVYINNHTTPYYGRLLAAGRTMMKENGIHSCWISSNGCQLKFEADGNTHTYNSTDELEDLINGKAPKQGPKNPRKRLTPDDQSSTSRMHKRFK